MNKEGKVVRIFDDEKIAINLGSADGLERNLRCFIYAPLVEIEDPDSGESLGGYRHLKTTAKIQALGERFAILGPYSRREKITESKNTLSWLAQQTRYEEIPGALPIRLEQASPIPSGDEISVGDTVFVPIEEATE